MFKRELEDKIKAELFPSFVNQVMQIKKNRLKILETEITQFEAKPLKDILEKLQETLRVFSTNLIDGFDSHRTLTTALLFQGSGWDIQINSFRKESALILLVTYKLSTREKLTTTKLRRKSSDRVSGWIVKKLKTYCARMKLALILSATKNLKYCSTRILSGNCEISLRIYSKRMLTETLKIGNGLESM